MVGALGWRVPLLLALMLFILVPLAATEIPPLQDYPNHLARMHILSDLKHNEVLRQIYTTDWAFIPNLLMDLVVPPLSRMMPLDMAGRLFVGVAMLAPVLGAVALHRAWFGAWHAWPWISALVAYNALLSYGLLNYVVGVGLALGGAAWFASERSGSSLLLGSAVAATWGLLCLVSHLVAFVLLLLLAGATLVGWFVSGGRGKVLRHACLLVPMALVPVALYLVLGPTESYARHVPVGHLLDQIRERGLLAGAERRLVWITAGFASEGVGGALTLVSTCFASGVAATAALRGRLRFASEPWLATFFLVLGFLLLPDVLADNAMVFQRLILPITLVSIAAVLPELPRAGREVAIGLGILLIAARGGAQAVDWSDQNRLLRDLRGVAAQVEPGARVLAVRDGSSPYFAEPDERGAQRNLRRAVAYTHLPALLVLDRNAFWPMVFATPGKQPLDVRPPYDQLAQPDGYLPLTRQLGESAATPPAAAGCRAFPTEAERPPCHMWSWPGRYDYVLRLNHSGATPPDPRLKSLAVSDFAALYRVVR